MQNYAINESGNKDTAACILIYPPEEVDSESV